jgi:hypothetical protein
VQIDTGLPHHEVQSVKPSEDSERPETV